jgi:FeS assembly SUF system protein
MEQKPETSQLDSAQPAAIAEGAAPARDAQAIYESVVAALRTVFDPEIPVNIYDLGLIYRIDVIDRRHVEVDMTLTAPGCPVAGEMLNMARNAIEPVESVASVKVNLVFDPPWDKSMMSEEAKLELGFVGFD